MCGLAVTRGLIQPRGRAPDAPSRIAMQRAHLPAAQLHAIGRGHVKILARGAHARERLIRLCNQLRRERLPPRMQKP